LACAGNKVTVFEKNDYPGGKLSELKLGPYRFDKGPSLLTLPQLIDDLTALSGFKEKFKYKQLDHLTTYFFADGTVIKASSSIDEFAKEIAEKLNEKEEVVKAYFEKCRFYYTTTFDLFLNQSLGKISGFMTTGTLKGLMRAPRLGLFQSMHEQNKKAFSNPKTVQIFDRYATYNGSNPYAAPALLNQIQHLEFGLGAYLPEKGMHDITAYLYKMALHIGVEFKFNEKVEQINTLQNKTLGLTSNGTFHASDLVVCNADMHYAYTKLIPIAYFPKKLMKQEKSSSAYVFYWGINRQFEELGLHNILFSDQYLEEFQQLFSSDQPFNDPTVYINITSKVCANDAPQGHENWFVMINVPHNAKQDKIVYGAELRKQVIRKINAMLKTDIENCIVEEAVLDPFMIEQQTSSFGGSLYGNASNNKFAAFLRHHNFHSKIKGLYFSGGSVHPGGGIPLCLLSAKITSTLIAKDYA